MSLFRFFTRHISALPAASTVDCSWHAVKGGRGLAHANEAICFGFHSLPDAENKQIENEEQVENEGLPTESTATTASEIAAAVGSYNAVAAHIITTEEQLADGSTAMSAEMLKDLLEYDNAGAALHGDSPQQAGNALHGDCPSAAGPDSTSHDHALKDAVSSAPSESQEKMNYI
jgi:hypothetical protein